MESALGPNGPLIEHSSMADLPECSFGRRTKLRWMSMLGPLALVVAVYWPSVGFDFVNWDDPWYVIDNPLIRSWHPANLYRIATEVAIKNYAPITMFSYLVDYTLWGDWAGGFHLTNLLLHALNAVLVYMLILRVTESRLTGVFSAALFAVHPVHIESVAWVSSRKGLLSGAFILASLIFWLKKDRSDRDEGYGLLFFTLALLSKAIAVVVPFVVLTYDVVVLRKSFASALARQAIPGFLAVMLLLITMSAQTTQMGGIRSHMELGKLHILAVDSIVLWKYVGMLVWPSSLCVLYNPPTTGIALGVVLSLIGWAAVVVALVRCRNRFPLIAFAAISFLAFLLPVLNLFPISTLMNDRYLYLPSIPFFAVVAGGLRRLYLRHSAFTFISTKKASAVFGTIVGMAAVTILVSFSVKTRSHLNVWRDGASLWNHTVQHQPKLTVVQIQLANTYHADGQIDQAISILEAALVNCYPDKYDRERIKRKLQDWKLPTEPRDPPLSLGEEGDSPVPAAGPNQTG